MKTFFSGIAAAAALCVTPVLVSAKEPSAGLALARQLNQAFIEVADEVSPAVVVIRIAHKQTALDLDDENNPFWDMLPRQYRKQLEEQWEKQRKENQPRERSPSREPEFDGQGSGVVIRQEGYILTNRHVVDGADKILVVLRDGTEYPAEVRGVDSQSDVAVLKIDAKGTKLVVAKLGDSEKTRVGEFAIAIGAPFALDYSVTFGHVSAKGRSRILDDPSMDQDFIQTDANINPGNSGGPLVNIDGEVIGINTLIRGMRTGIGFAIPANLAREVADQLITEGRFTRAYLGVKIKSLKEDPEYREMMTNITAGVIISEIPPGGPAAKSELKPGDIITSVDGKPVATSQQLKNEIRSKKIGHPVALDVHRNGKNIKVSVKPEAWPDQSPQVASKRNSTEEVDAQPFGLKVESITKDLAETYGIERLEGVVVTEVARGSVAESKGIKAGDVVTEVNRKAVTTPRQFREAIKGGNPKKGIIINFTSGRNDAFTILKETGE